MQAECENFPNIFDYADFRRFLDDYSKARKQKDSKFTHSEFCRQLGLPNTRSFVRDVINGRKISDYYLERFSNVFAFNKEEAEYFRVLVYYNQANQESDKELFLDQLVSLNKAPKKELNAEKWEYFRTWYHPVVFSLIDMLDFKGDYKALAKKVMPPITAKQARESVKLLLKLKLIKRVSGSGFKVVTNNVGSPEMSQAEMIKQYQLQQANLSKECLLNPPEDPHAISTMTLGVSKKALVKVDKKIKKLHSDIRSLIQKDDDKSELVYQMNLQLFPIGKK